MEWGARMLLEKHTFTNILQAAHLYENYVHIIRTLRVGPKSSSNNNCVDINVIIKISS